ncbi:MAG: PAS domain-containing protein, partial [Thermoguttaceae bacterium]
MTTTGKNIAHTHEKKLFKASAKQLSVFNERGSEQFAIVQRDWEHIFDSLPDLIAILDPQHRIMRANRALSQRLGKTPEECVGLHCFRCMHDLDSPPDYCP